MLYPISEVVGYINQCYHAHQLQNKEYGKQPQKPSCNL